MKTLMAALLGLALLLPACGGGGGYVEEECFCDEFGCDCFVYEDPYYYAPDAPAYDAEF